MLHNIIETIQFNPATGRYDYYAAYPVGNNTLKTWKESSELPNDQRLMGYCWANLVDHLVRHNHI